MNEKMEKANEYFKLLHPEFDTLTSKEKVEVMDDSVFIVDNFDMIETMYENGCTNGMSPEEAIKKGMNLIKVNKYKHILYSHELDFVQEEKFSEEQQQAYDKRQQELKEKMNFVRNHIDEIDQYYKACVQQKNGTIYEGMTEQQILEEAIESVNKKISGNISITDNKKEDVVRNEEEMNLEEIMPVDESKYAEIYGKAKGIIKEAFSKIKSFLNVKSNDRSDKTNDETIR